MYFPHIVSLHTDYLFKVAEHSFQAQSCQCNSACAQALHENKHGVNTEIILFAQYPRYLYYFSSQLNTSVLMVLLFYYKGMLEKVTMQRTQKFSAFSLLLKEPS